MARAADPELVRRVLDVTDFDERTAKVLATRGRAMSVPARWSLMAEQTPADEAYLLLEGEVAIRKDGQEIAVLGPGEFLGEMALVNHRLRSASALARTPVRALHFTEEAVSRLVDDVPGFAAAVQAAAQSRAASNAERSAPNSPDARQ